MKKPAVSLPRQTPRKTTPPDVVITKRYEEILQAVYTYRFVTAIDIARLFFSPTTINHSREILSLLSGKQDYAERHYLYRFPLPNTRIGGTEKIYTLGSQGRMYLQSQGMQVDWYFRPYKVAGMTYQNCLHALTLTRFLVAAHVFVKQHPEWELSTLRTEYELKKELAEEKAKQQAVTIPLTLDNGKEQEEVVVIPDAWLLFQKHNKKKDSVHPVFVEIDRASEQQKYFKRQVRARALFLTNGGYTKLFGTNKGVIAYATTGNQTRVDSMRKWTHDVLAELKLKKLTSRFLFCNLMPSWEQDTTRLFLSPLWYKAGQKSGGTLLA